jgi:hypothetical protein
MKKKQKNNIHHFLLVLGIVLVSIFSNSYRAIPKYYKNMAYVSSFNILYYILCRRHLVWEFIPSGANWNVIRVVYMVIVTPLLTLNFLSKLPQELSKQGLYLIKWVLTASFVEYLAHKNKLILYGHGWSVFWSGFLYLIMFVYSYIFTIYPKKIVLLSLCTTVFFVYKFRVPFRKKHYSKYFEPLVDLRYHTFLEDVFSQTKRRLC